MLCNNKACDAILCNKVRNVYCREALDARRLGHCTTGTRVAQQFSERDGSARCWCCKHLLQPKSQSLVSRSSSISGRSSTSGLVSLRRQRKAKARSVFEHAFELALDAEAKAQQYEQPMSELDGTTELQIVRDLEALESKRATKRPKETSSDETTSPSHSATTQEQSSDPYGLQQSYTIRDTWFR